MQMQPVAGWSPYAGTGQNVSKEPAVGRPTVACSSGPARLLLPFKPQTARAGEGGERQPADGQPRHCVLWRLAEVPRGERAEGSLGAELQTLPTSAAALVFICHVHCDLFPVRFGLNKGFTAEKRFKTTDLAQPLLC